MLILSLDQTNDIPFVLVDNAGTEVAGLGGAFNVWVRKPAGAFAVGAGANAELGNGWYVYTATAGESDTYGSFALRITGAGVVQQNLVCTVDDAPVPCETCISYTYTVTDSGTGLPIDGVRVWVTTDVGGANVIWCGYTDAFGVARDSYGNLPLLDAGTYYFWKQRGGYMDDDNPDTEVVV